MFRKIVSMLLIFVIAAGCLPFTAAPVKAAELPAGAWTEVFLEAAGDGGTDTVTFTPVNARYVLLYCEIRQSQYWGFQVQEFRIFNGTENLSLGKTASASSGTASNAIDGKGWTEWASPAPEGGYQWLQVDLGSEAEGLNRVEIQWSGQYAKQYRILVRSDEEMPDETPPVITPDQSDGTVTEAVYTISGSVNEPSDVTIRLNDGDEETIAEDSTVFSRELTLAGGVNTILIKAADAAGNESAVTLHITLDTTPGQDHTPPVITPDQSDGTVTEAVYTISGSVSEPSDVTITLNSGTEETIAEDSTAFSKVLTLAEGLNVITVKATDAAGNTSAAVLRITLETGLEPGTRMTFVDETEDLLKVFESREVILETRSSEPSKKFAHAYNDNEAFVIYKSLSGDIFSYDLELVLNRWVVSMLPGRVPVEVFASPDNVTYTKVDSTVIEDTATGVTYYTDRYTNGSLPKGTRYLKICFNNNSTFQWGVLVSRVSYDFNNEFANPAPTEATVVDETVDYSKVAWRENITMQAWGYDSSMKFMREYNDDDAYLLYRTPSGDIKSFELEACVNRWEVENNIPEKTPFTIGVSSNDQTYTYLTPEVIPDPNPEATNNFFKDTYTVSSLPAGTKYIRIQFNNKNSSQWAVHLSRFAFTHAIAYSQPGAPAELNVVTRENVPVSGTVGATGSQLNYSVGSQPAHGTAVIENSGADQWNYTPDMGFIGYDSFDVLVTDAGGGSAVTRVNVFVNYAPTYLDYYVDGNGGSDDNDGLTVSTAFKTIQKAHDVSKPGDTIYIMDGTYTETNAEGALWISRSGLPDAYITYRAYPGHKPKIHCTVGWNHILVASACYITIDGITIEGNNDNITYQQALDVYNKYISGEDIDWTLTGTTNANGIFVRPDKVTGILPHHIEIRNCTVTKVPGGGIGVERADYITIENNRVFGNCTYNLYANSGISLFHMADIDGNETTYKNIVRGNISYDNENTLPWFTTGNMSDGNGIIIDDTKNTQIGRIPYKGRTLVINNLCYENGGSGIHSYSSSNVDIINNTVYNNSRTEELTYAQIFAADSDNVNIINNIIYARTGELVNNVSNSRNAVYDYNVYFNGTVNVNGPNDITADPKFADIAGGNFSLLPDSPALDSASAAFAPGTDIRGLARPQGGGYDRGAYEGFADLADATGPVITLDQGDGTVYSAVYTVSGSLNEAAIVTIKLNGDTKEVVEAEDTFSALLTLAPGQNIITVLARDSAGNTSEKVLTVTYDTDANRFVVKDITFTDLSGNTVTGLGAGTFVRAGITLVNNTQEPVEATLVIALFGPGHSVKNLSLITKEAAAGQTDRISAGFDLPESIDGYFIKVFVWNNLTEMIPLSEAIPFD